MAQLIAELLISVFDAVIVIFFINRYLERNQVHKVEILFGGLITLMGFLGNELLTYHGEFYGIGLVIILTYSFIVGKGQYGKSVFAGILIYALIGIVSMMVVFGVSGVLQIDFTRTAEDEIVSDLMIIITFGKIITMVFVAMILRVSRKSLIYNLNLKEWAVLIISTVLVLLVLVIMFYTIFEDAPKGAGIYGLIGVLLLGLLTAIYFILVRINTANLEKIKFQRTLSIYENQQKNILEKEMEYKNLRVIKHDLRHYFSTISGLIQEGKCQDALQYMEKVTNEKMESLIQLVETGNDIIDASINSKLVHCKEKNINIEFSLSGCWQFENAMDIGIVLCNLLENAILAAEGTKEHRLIMSSRTVKNYMQIDITNSYEKNRFKESKELFFEGRDAKDHGWGLVSVKKILEQYNGYLIQSEEEGQFVTTILIPYVS